MYNPVNTKPVSARRRALFHDLQPSHDDFRAAVIVGLSRERKSIPCRFLYDATGSALFDKICSLPEYYPTRTETKILYDNAGEIAGYIGAHAQVVELGSGSSTKIRILLDALDAPMGYVPVDISAEHLRAAAQIIQDDYPALCVEAICADYAQQFALPPSQRGRRLGFYPGSTIGNLTPDQAEAFLMFWADRLGAGAAMLVGVDLRKNASVLEHAYNDSQGITAAFSLNLLTRANRELDANFNTQLFQHEAHYLADEGRVAIYVRSLAAQTVRIGDRSFALAAGERIHIEDSWKYSLSGFQALAARAGFASVDSWVDAQNLFSVHLLDVVETGRAMQVT